MTDIDTSGVRRQYGASSAALCQYCQAPLDPFYYFCLRCATPYKPAISIVGHSQPVPLSDADRVRKLAPATWTVFWTYAAVLIGAALISLPFITPENFATFYLVSSLAVLITTAIFGVIHWRPLAAQFREFGFLKWEAWAGVAALAPLLALNFGYHYLVRQTGEIHVAELPNNLPMAISVLLFCVFPAVSEEIAFRGLVQYWLDVSLTPGKALLLGSTMFAGLHFSLISFPYLFLVGALLAVVRRRTKSLYPGMLIHFLHNLVVIMLFR